MIWKRLILKVIGRVGEGASIAMSQGAVSRPSTVACQTIENH